MGAGIVHEPSAAIVRVTPNQLRVETRSTRLRRPTGAFGKACRVLRGAHVEVALPSHVSPKVVEGALGRSDEQLAMVSRALQVTRHHVVIVCTTVVIDAINGRV